MTTGNPLGLAMTMKRGNLVRRGMVVKFKARYRHAGHIEAVEILTRGWQRHPAETPCGARHTSQAERGG